MNVPPATTAASKDLLRANNIGNITIIDDAYDETPTRAAFSADALAQLLVSIQSWQHPTAECAALSLSIHSELDITDAVLQSIYSLRPTSEEIASWFTDYDNVQEQRRALLRPLESLLRTDLECSVQTLSPHSSFDPSQLPEIIFIDYYLDQNNQVANSLDLASRIGLQIRQTFVDIPKPLVILMSTAQALTELQKSQFRDQAKFLGGMFYFIPKEELKPAVSFLLRLAVLVSSLNEGRQVQEFVDTFEGDLSDTFEKFKTKVRALSLEDYAYIQKLTLHREGMPLGDYLLWLFGTYFGHLLFRSAPKQRRQLDAMHFAHVAESDGMPSAGFRDLYRNVVAEEVDALAVHPRAVRAQPEGELGPPDPHFGDVFMNDNKEVRMIITAECDLLYAPEKDAGREHQPDQSVFIAPGLLETLDPASSDKDILTSFFPLGENTYQIRWQLNKVSSVPFASLRAHMELGGYRRCARIRHPFATLVQTSFTNDLTRVAIPVAPPMLRSVSVSVYCLAPDGKPEISHPPVPGTLYTDRKERADHVHLKVQTAVDIIEVAQQVLERTEQLLSTEPVGNTRLRLESDRQRLTEFLSDLGSHMLLHTPFRIKPKGSYPFPRTPVEATRDFDKLAVRLNSTPVVVLIQDEEQLVEEAAPVLAPAPDPA